MPGHNDDRMIRLRRRDDARDGGHLGKSHTSGRGGALNYDFGAAVACFDCDDRSRSPGALSHSLADSESLRPEQVRAGRVLRYSEESDSDVHWRAGHCRGHCDVHS